MKSERNGKKVLALTGLVITLALFTAGMVVAGNNAHFIDAKTSVQGFSSQLSVTFKAAGLGNIAGQNVTVELYGDIDGYFRCRTKGGNCPAAPNKRGTGHILAAAGTYVVQSNGQAAGTLTVDQSVVPQPNDLLCPTGQAEVRVGVDYTNMELQLKYNGEVLDSIPLADASAAVKPSPCKKG